MWVLIEVDRWYNDQSYLEIHEIDGTLSPEDNHVAKENLLHDDQMYGGRDRGANKSPDLVLLSFMQSNVLDITRDRRTFLSDGLVINNFR